MFTRETKKVYKSFREINDEDFNDLHFHTG